MAKDKTPQTDKADKAAQAEKAEKAGRAADKAAKAAKAAEKPAEKPAKSTLPVPPARLAAHYREKVVPDLLKKFGYKTSMEVPRIRDFRGVSNRAFDGRGNYSLGVKEQIIFPEIEYDKVDALRGMNIAITTTAKTDDEAKALLAAFRFPFKH